MRFLYSIILVLLCQVGFSQTYKFNLLTNYKYYNAYFENYQDSYIYSNISDQSYFMRLYEQEDKAYIFDLKKKKRYELNVSKKFSNGKGVYVFKLIKTINSNGDPRTKNHNFKFETVSEDSTHTILKMTKFKSKKNKGTPVTSELTFKKSSTNLFPLFRYSYLHLYETHADIDPGINGIVESIKYPGREGFSAWLESAEKVDIEINLDSAK